MADVFGVHQQLDFAIDGNGELRGYDIVPGLYVIGEVQPKVISVALINLVRVKRGKLSIRSGVAEIERKLARLRLDLHCVWLRSGKINLGPGLLSEDPQGQN